MSYLYLKKELNVVSLFEEMTQCRIIIWLNVNTVGERTQCCISVVGRWPIKLTLCLVKNSVLYPIRERTQCRIFNLRWRKVSMSYLHILQHGCVISVILSGDLSKINYPLVSVQGQSEEEQLSRLSTRSIQKLILVTLSYQYKVKSRNNDPLVFV